MKKIKILSLLFCVVMLVAACHDDEEGPIYLNRVNKLGALCWYIL